MTTPHATDDRESEPKEASGSLKPYSVLKSYVIDGLLVEFIQKGSEDSQEICSDDGDDASTVCMEEDLEEVKEEIEEIIDESFYSAADETKLQLPLIPVTEEAEEGYEGAAGLWAKDYQLPCFNLGVEFNAPTFSKVEEVLLKSAYLSVPFNRCEMPLNTSVFNDSMKMSEDSIINTKEPANCGVCKREIDVGRGIVLKGCLHTFCRRCLVHSIENSKTAVMMCPSKMVCCQGEVRDDEIKAMLTPEGYDKYVTEQLIRMEVIDLAEIHDSYDYVENKNVFCCDLCIKDCATGDGIVLKNCLHQFCKPCLSQHIQTSDEVEIPCPYRTGDGSNCIGILMDTEVRSLISIEVYVGLLGKSLKIAENSNPAAYHCKTPGCLLWIEILGEVDEFECGACQRVNCVLCKAVHQGVSCENYQQMLHGGARRF